MSRAVWTTAMALAGAVLIETALAHLVSSPGRYLDPFLLVVVYCALVRGETHGMLAGAAAGWLQDVMFGGRVLGLSALAKLLVQAGWCVWSGGARGIDGAAHEGALAGPGFRTMTRLAASPYELWRDICLTNSENLARALERLEQRLARMRGQLRSGELAAEFEKARQTCAALRKEGKR